MHILCYHDLRLQLPDRLQENEEQIVKRLHLLPFAKDLLLAPRVFPVAYRGERTARRGAVQYVQMIKLFRKILQLIKITNIGKIGELRMVVSAINIGHRLIYLTVSQHGISC